MSNEEVRERLTDTADDLGSPGKDLQYGYGRVDAFAALGGGEAVLPTIESDTDAVVRRENVTLTVTGEGYREYWLSIDDAGLADAGMYPQIVPDQQDVTPGISSGEISGSAGFDETECRVLMPGSGTARIRYTTNFSTAARPFNITIADPKDPVLSDSILVSVNPGTVTITAGDRDRFFFGEEVTFNGTNTDNRSTWLYLPDPALRPLPVWRRFRLRGMETGRMCGIPEPLKECSKTGPIQFMRFQDRRPRTNSTGLHPQRSLLNC
jgi:hypothetical protein